MHEWVTDPGVKGAQLIDGVQVVIANGRLNGHKATEKGLGSSLLKAWERMPVSYRVDGEYALVGQRVNGNPYRKDAPYLLPQGRLACRTPTTIEDLTAWLAEDGRYYGIRYTHPDGRTFDVKRTDLGLPWPDRR